MSINGALIAGVIAIGFTYTLALVVIGHVHSRRNLARQTHPAAQAAATPTSEAGSARENARRREAPSGQTDELGEGDESVEIAADGGSGPDEAPERQPAVHPGLAEMIHALGPEPPRVDGPHPGPLSSQGQVPQRFRRFESSDGHLDLTELISHLLTEVGYKVTPSRGDLAASRGDERLMVRVLPWDGTFDQVGERTTSRFEHDFSISRASDGICVSEALMPPSAAKAEAKGEGLWFVGRERLPRLLESIDAALALTRPTLRHESDK